MELIVGSRSLKTKDVWLFDKIFIQVLQSLMEIYCFFLFARPYKLLVFGYFQAKGSFIEMVMLK